MRIAAGPARPTRVRGGFRMIRAVLFDLDDTLFDHRHGARQALAAVRTGHDALIRLDPADFERRHAEILEVLHLRVLAKEIGLDVKRFIAEVDAGKYKEAVENEVKQGEVAGVQGTPSFFFNGRRYSGAFQADAVAQLLQTEFKIAPR